MEYFDDDYLTVPSYEFLRRYPDVFDGAQLCIWGTVKKVLSLDSNTVEMVLWLDVGPVEYEYFWEYPEYEGNYIRLNGQVGNISYMEGDTLLVYGRYNGIETVEMDGVSYTIPKVNVQVHILTLLQHQMTYTAIFRNLICHLSSRWQRQYLEILKFESRL